MYRDRFTDCKTSREFGCLVWRRYLADYTNVKTNPTLEEQDALASLASSIMNMAVPDADVECVRSSPAIPENKEDWAMGNLAKMDVEERAGMTRHLCALKNHVVSRGGWFREVWPRQSI